MRPWQHSCSSIGSAAPATGSEWATALEVHEFIDLSKSACADRRHRLVLHHVDCGAAVARLAFPDVAALDTWIAQHVREDLGREAVLADWLNGVDRSRWPRPVRRRIADGPQGLARLVCAKLPDHPETTCAAEAVANLLFLPTHYVPDAPELALGVLMNTVGPTLARRVFGPPRIDTVDRTRIVIDYGWIAEAVIMAAYGRIPDLREAIEALSDEPILRRTVPRGVAA
jgi:hypothetical protein